MGGRGHPHAGGEGAGVESQQAWPGRVPRTRGAQAGRALRSLLRQEPLLPRGPWPGAGERPGGGRGPREIVLSGCVPEKGLQTPAQQGPGNAPGVGKGATAVAGGPWTRRRVGGLSCAQAGCYQLFQGAIPMPGRDTHTCTHTLPPSLHSVPSKHLRSHTNTDRTKCTATKMDRNSPSYPQTVHCTVTWSF